jgi:hypothetical protein
MATLESENDTMVKLEARASNCGTQLQSDVQLVLEDWQKRAAKAKEEGSGPAPSSSGGGGKGGRKPRDKKDMTKEILKGLKLVLKQLTIHTNEREKQLHADYIQTVFRYRQVAI